MSDLIIQNRDGLHCRAGGFTIDPWRKVPVAVITHGHSDHARRGSGRYICTPGTASILRNRLGKEIELEERDFSEPWTLGETTVSFHPAGHLLGSAQVRVERNGAKEHGAEKRSEVWVASGDYKIAADPTCRPFEVVPCDVFISECTFGLPVYRWPPTSEVMAEVNRWWAATAETGRTSVLFAYSLGKAQRVLAGLDESIGPILLHGSVSGIVDIYRKHGVSLPRAQYAKAELVKKVMAEGNRALVLAPPGAAGSSWLRRFQPASLAFASGWMQVRGNRRRRALDRGFVISDHVDWPGLMQTIERTGCRRVLLTHGQTDAAVRYLRERGMDAGVLQTEYGEEVPEAALEEDS